MKSRLYLPILLYCLFFLFYPGDSFYIKTFAYNRALFASRPEKIDYQAKKAPYLINKYFLPQTSAQGVYVVDLDSFTPIWEKNAKEKFLPASTTKIITSLTAFDIYDLDDVLTVERVVAHGQVMDLVLGEKMTFENLLYGILVHSGNDAAFVLADNYRQGFDQFIEAMNKKAEEIGMENSIFKNPAGFDDFGQYTTPFDLALAGREVLKNKTLAKIVSTKSITVSDADFKYFHPLYNVNKLLGEIPGIGGLKTGFTLDAGENLISFYKETPPAGPAGGGAGEPQEGHNFLIVILKSEDRFKDTEKVVEWINANVDYINI